MVNINRSDMFSTLSFVNSVSEGYYPSGRMIINNTSFSKEGVTGRTLTNRSVSDVLSGDTIYRSPKFSLALHNKVINSSLNSMITSGAESTYSSASGVSLSVQDPESISYTSEDSGVSKPTLIHGGAAFNRILANSLLGTQAGAGFINEPLQQLYITQLSANTRKVVYVDGVAHGADLEVSYDANAISAGSRGAALQSLLIPGEEGWILERGKILKDAQPRVIQDFGVLSTGYSFDLADNLTGLKYSDGDSNFPGLASNTNTVDAAIIKAPRQKLYVCPALLECLIYLRSRIHFYGAFSLGRINDRRTVVTNNAAVTNHAFGRAIDINEIGLRSVAGVNHNMNSNAGNIAIYRNALTLLLTAINTMPDHLKPDMLVVDSALANELGIQSGAESASAAVYKKYPGCKHINFHPDPTHNDHIHMSFSAARAGIYTGPGGSFATTVAAALPGSTTSNGYVISPYGAMPISGTQGVSNTTFNSKFVKNFISNPSERLSPSERTQLFGSTVCSLEAAAMFSAIAAREGGVVSLNSDTSGGDFSIGMTQTTMLVHGGKLFTLASGSSAVSLEGWKIASANWQQLGLTSLDAWKSYVRNAFNTKTTDYANYNAKMLALVDTRIWIPLNQAFMLYTTVKGPPAPFPFPPSMKIGLDPFSGGNIFSPWGDYAIKDGGPVPGPIWNIRYSSVRDSYVGAGGNENTLRKWILNFYSGNGGGSTSRSAQIIVSWLDGAFYGNRNSLTAS
jgi:hypothetical protein